MDTILAYLFNPTVFFGTLAAVFVISLGVLFSWSRRDTKLRKDNRALMAKIGRPVPEMEARLLEKDREYQAKIRALEVSLQAKENEFKGIAVMEVELRGQVEELRATLKKTQEELEERRDVVKKYNALRDENEVLQMSVDKLKAQLLQKEALHSRNNPAADENVRTISSLQETVKKLGQEIARRDEDAKQYTTLQDENEILQMAVDKLKAQIAQREPLHGKDSNTNTSKVADLQDQLAKARQDAELKNQLYDGLKAQYGELEKSFEGLMQQLEQEKKSQQLLSQRLWELSRPKES